MPLRARGRTLALLGACLALQDAAGAAQRSDARDCRTDYAIRARVDDDARMLTGEAQIRWRNESLDDVPDLWFHLYWNAFANNRSTHMEESGGELRGVAIEDEWGWQRVTSVQVDGRELLPSLRYRQPDDGRTQDRSVFSVPLVPLAKPGASVDVRVTWEAKIPRVRRRTGYKGDFLFVAQWFPKLGVYETGNGWNCHQFHASTEFFSDYGTYDVVLDLPAEYEGKIGASGVLVEPVQAGNGRVVAHFVAPSPRDQVRAEAEPLVVPEHVGTNGKDEVADRNARLPLVHDFAWTADPDFVVHEATFHFDEWAERYPEEIDHVVRSLGCKREDVRLRDVVVAVYLQPEHADQALRHFDATCTALFFYGLWFGEYPYERVSVVDPAWGGGAAGGMEYPTLFTAGSRKFTFPGMLTPESVTVHECGHQFWYGLVGNNEFEASWLDEGFNTYTQNEALVRRYGRSHRTTDFANVPFDGVALAKEPGGGVLGDALALRKWSLPFSLDLEPVRGGGFLDWWRLQPTLSFGRVRDDPRWGARNGYLAAPDSDPIDTFGWKYVDRESYRQNSYRRTAVALRSLEGLVGSERFLRGMRYFAETWRYRHPYPHDFFRDFVVGSGADVAWYFEEVFRGTATIDWTVEVKQKQVADDKGWFQNAEGVFEKRTAAREEPRAENGDVAAEEQERPGKDWDVDLLVRRRGELALPLTLELAWEGGETERLVWTRDSQSRSTWWRPLEGRGHAKRKLVSAVLDPDRKYYFDMDMSDNQWFEAVDKVAPLRWSERILTQYAHLLHWYGGIGG